MTIQRLACLVLSQTSKPEGKTQLPFDHYFPQKLLLIEVLVTASKAVSPKRSC